MSQLNESISTTAVERYFARADHGKGMIFDVVVILEGEVDLERLAKSWQETISENARAFFHLSGHGAQWVWKQVPFSPELFGIQEAKDGEIDIHRGVGACLSMTSTPVGSADENCIVDATSLQLKFSFHHSVCDGVGAARLIYQTLKRYRDGKLASRRETQVADTRKPSLLAKGALVPKFANFWATIRGHNARLGRHAIGRATNNASRLMARESESVFLGFGADRSERIRVRLREMKIPVNDFGVAVVLHGLAVAIRPANRRYISLMNPVQMRSWGERNSTGNHIGFAFIRRRHDQLSSIQETLESVSGEMNHVRASGSAAELSRGLEIAERIPGGLSCIDRLGWFIPTASVTCLSGIKLGKRTGLSAGLPRLGGNTSSQAIQDAQTYQAGNAMVKGVRILGPLQSRGQLSITMWDTGSGLNLSLRGPAKQTPGDLESIIAREIEQAVDTFLCE